MREVISNKIKLSYGKDKDGKSKGSWTFSKVVPDVSAESAYLLAGGLNTLQEHNNAEFYRIKEYKISR